jgi:hypothetical protein
MEDVDAKDATKCNVESSNDVGVEWRKEKSKNIEIVVCIKSKKGGKTIRWIGMFKLVKKRQYNVTYLFPLHN